MESNKQKIVNLIASELLAIKCLISNTDEMEEIFTYYIFQEKHLEKMLLDAEKI